MEGGLLSRCAVSRRLLSTLLVVSLLMQGALVAAAPSTSELVAQVPQCALPCMLQAITDGNCTIATIEPCLCGNIRLQSSLSTCVQKSCIFSDQVKASGLEGELCEAWPKESKTHGILVALITGSAIVFPIIAMRFYARFAVSKLGYLDDWFTLIATICLAALVGIEIASAQLGFGTHYWTVNPANGVKLLQLFYAVQMIYIVIQVTAKVAILFLLARIFPARWLRIAIRVMLTFLFLHGTIYLFLVMFQCVPLAAIWDRNITDRKCVNFAMLASSGAIFSIVEDIIILVLPIPEVLKLQMDTRKKCLLLFMFSLGSFACVTSMVRLKYTLMFPDSFDSTWDSVDVVLWSVIESYAAMLCGSLPAVRPLLAKCAPIIFSSTTWRKSTRDKSSTGFSSTSDRRRKSGAALVSGDKNVFVQIDDDLEENTQAEKVDIEATRSGVNAESKTTQTRKPRLQFDKSSISSWNNQGNRAITGSSRTNLPASQERLAGNDGIELQSGVSSPAKPPSAYSRY